MKRLLRAAVNTWNGLLATAKTEAAFREEIGLLLFSIPAAFIITTETWKRVTLVGVVFFTLIVELLNTAIEKLADRVTLDNDAKIGLVKDVGSAAVGLALAAILFLWLLALCEHIF